MIYTKNEQPRELQKSHELIKIVSLTKFYKKFMALNDISLSLKRGRIVGLLGRNGAGKSTLMRCILGFLRYNGDIFIQDELLSHADFNIFNNIGFIPDVNELDERLTVSETIEYISGIHPKWNQGMADKLISISDLPLKKKVKKLSKGMRTKLYLLITLSLDVDILLLDEPTIGLDIVFKKEFYDIILSEFFDSNKLIIISTHQIEEIENLIQEIIFIHEGRLLLHDDVDILKSKYNMVTLPIERSSELEPHNPIYKKSSLGLVSGLLKSDITIDGASYLRPTIVELFLGATGGCNEKY